MPEWPAGYLISSSFRRQIVLLLWCLVVFRSSAVEVPSIYHEPLDAAKNTLTNDNKIQKQTPINNTSDDNAQQAKSSDVIIFKSPLT